MGSNASIKREWVPLARRIQRTAHHRADPDESDRVIGQEIGASDLLPNGFPFRTIGKRRGLLRHLKSSRKRHQGAKPTPLSISGQEFDRRMAAPSAAPRLRRKLRCLIQFRLHDPNHLMADYMFERL